MSLGKKNIASNISSKAHTTSDDSHKIIESFIKLIIFKGGADAVKISNFGTFSTKITPQRLGRNPKTKENFIISRRSKLNFKTSSRVKKILN